MSEDKDKKEKDEGFDDKKEALEETGLPEEGTEGLTPTEIRGGAGDSLPGNPARDGGE